MIKQFSVIAVILIIIAFSSCTSCRDEGYFYPQQSGIETEAAVPEAAFMAEKSADISVMKTPGKNSGPDSGGTDGNTAYESAQQARKRIYSGEIVLSVEDKDKIRKSIEALASELGGYTEKSSSDLVVIRVPYLQFESSLQSITEMGRVESLISRTEDVTDRYSDLKRRMEINIAARERLYELLDKTADSSQKVEILREIGRLTEEIEYLKRQIELIDNQAEFSRITVHLNSPEDNQVYTDTIPFPWIADLNPLEPAGSKLKGKVYFDPGEDFAVFKDKPYYMASNTEGVRVYISSIDNIPRGSSEFWQKALEYNLKDFYKTVTPCKTETEQSTVYGVELVSGGLDPYRYYVGVSASGKQLYIIEFFSPDSGYSFSSLFNALSAGRIP